MTWDKAVNISKIQGYLKKNSESYRLLINKKDRSLLTIYLFSPMRFSTVRFKWRKTSCYSLYGKKITKSEKNKQKRIWGIPPAITILIPFYKQFLCFHYRIWGKQSLKVIVQIITLLSSITSAIEILANYQGIANWRGVCKEHYTHLSSLSIKKTEFTVMYGSLTA